MKLLNHKSHTKILEWLNDLVGIGYLGRNYERKFSPDPGSYFLKQPGVKVLRNIEDVDKNSLRILNREHKKKKRFISHCFLVTEIYIHYLKLAQDDKVHFKTRIEMDSDKFLFEPKPDAYIAIEESGQVIKRYFLEVFDPGTFKTKVYARIQQYLNYSEDGEWQRQTGHDFPEVLVVCPDLAMKHKVFRFLKAVLNEDSYYEVTFHLATKEAIKYHGVGIGVWQDVKPV